MKRFVSIRQVLFSLVIIITFFAADKVQAQQNKFRLEGIVTDSIDSKPIEMAIVSIPDLNIWSRTNELGQFELKEIPKGKHIVRFYILGYQEKSVTKLIDANIYNWDEKLQPLSLALQEVNVTASEVKFGSVSKISSEAIEHIQPKSLSDVFQLLPGQITQNPSLSTPGQVNIRGISNSDNSALGALVIVDGAHLTNNSNRAGFNTAKAGNNSTSPTTAGRGIDLRDLSAENIESVEIIKGIPSSEYGDLTSGVVIVKTKIGEQPWTVKAKADPNSKLGSVYKGFKLPSGKGFTNFGIDYAKAYDDTRKKSSGYERITGTAQYSNTFMKNHKPLDFNLRFSFHKTIDNDKTDPQLKKDEVTKASQKGFRGGVDGRWLLTSSWITNLEYSLTADYSVMEGYVNELQVLTSGAVPYPTSYETGVFQEQFLPGVYYSEYTSDGKPYNVYGKLKASLIKEIGQSVNSISTGINVSVSGNNGNGLQYDIERPPLSSSALGTRPRADKDIPALKNYAFFIENKIAIPIKNTELTSQLGFRFVNVQPGNYNTIEPRWNTEFVFLTKRNNQIFDRFGINFGIGLSSKMPTLSYISPDKAYFDNISLNRYEGQNSLTIVTTNVLDTKNPYLKPAKSTKKEIGFSFSIKDFSVSVTGYHEKLTNGLGFSPTPYIFPYEKFSVPREAKNPVFENGQVYYTENGQRVQATSVMDTVMYSYSTPSNNETFIKKGIEYVINIGKINAIRSSFVIDGAWMYEESYGTKPYYYRVYNTYDGKPYPYLSLMPAGQRTINQRMNTNIRMITHIPELKVIMSLTTQIIWNTKSKTRWNDNDGNSLIYYNDQYGNRVYGDAALTDMDVTRYVDPIGFYDKSGTLHEWKPEYSTDSRYSSMRHGETASYYFVEESLPPAALLNLRITKEFSQNLSLSFMANNFLKMNPLQKSNRTSLYVRRNTNYYFGAEVNYRF